jgi:hypothetical protein
MTASRIALIGAGGIGRRHLEALALSKHPLRIFVADPSSEALAAARNATSGIFSPPHSVSFHTATDEFPSKLDVAIVATTADVRRYALEMLLQRSKPRYVILEKVLFQRLDDYDAVARRLADEGIAAWVNCPRRLWPHYQHLREEIAEPAGLTIHAAHGPAIGLGSNAVHMLDLLAFLSRCDDIEIDASRLHLYRGPIKRNAIEFTGTLVAQTKRGALLTYTTPPHGTNPVSVDIDLPERRIQFEETAGLARQCNAAGGWQWVNFDARPVFQSRLTNEVVDRLIARGDCGLTPYTESAALHMLLLRALAHRLSELGVACGDEVKIT